MQMKTHTHLRKKKKKAKALKIHALSNELKQQPCTHTSIIYSVLYTSDKALSKDKKPREFTHIFECHKSLSLAISPERTADIFINVTKREMSHGTL